MAGLSVISKIALVTVGVGATASSIAVPIVLTSNASYNLKSSSERNFTKDNCRLAIESSEADNKKQLIVCSFDEDGDYPMFYLYSKGSTPKNVTSMKKSTQENEIELEFENADTIADQGRQERKLKATLPTEWTDLLGKSLSSKCDFVQNSKKESSEWKINCGEANSKKEIMLKMWNPTENIIRG